MLLNLAVARWSGRFGRRNWYAVLYLALAASGALLALGGSFQAWLLAALLGVLSADVLESGPFTSLEQAMLPQLARDRQEQAGNFGFAPTLPLALGLLLARHALSQMDVPTRQAYLAALVPPEERAAAAALTNSARLAVRPGPLLAGALLQVAWPGAPFLVAGALKIVYDLGLHATFRRVELEE